MYQRFERFSKMPSGISQQLLPKRHYWAEEENTLITGTPSLLDCSVIRVDRVRRTLVFWIVARPIIPLVSSYHPAHINEKKAMLDGQGLNALSAVHQLRSTVS